MESTWESGVRILIACECSGRVRDAFIAQGHDAMSADLQPTDAPGPHYQGDVFDILGDGFDILVAHPPCTYLANSGVRWLYNPDGTTNQTRWEGMRIGADFFRVLHEQYQIPKVCIENPIPHRHAGLPEYTQLIQPWQFGDNYSKATCLWLRGLPPLVPTVMTKPDNVEHACHLEPPGPDRQKNRSRTYPGIADQMALQWGTDWYPPAIMEQEL